MIGLMLPLTLLGRAIELRSCFAAAHRSRLALLKHAADI